MIAGVAGLFIVLWIFVYIFFIYPKNEVYVTGIDDSLQREHKRMNMQIKDADEDIDDDYSKQSKPLYVFKHAFTPLILGLSFIIYFFVA